MLNYAKKIEAQAKKIVFLQKTKKENKCIIYSNSRIHKIKCKDCNFFPKYENIKENLIKYKSLSFNKNYSNKIDEDLKKRFNNASELSNSNINKFILLLRNGIYPCEYIDEKENFNETSLIEKEEIYNNLNTEDITDSDHMHVKRVCKDFQIKKLGEYHNFCL